MTTENLTKVKVKINIRGVRFETRCSTLRFFPKSLLASLNHNSEYWDEENDEYFFERDPDIFNSILNLYTMHELHVPKNICGTVFRKEMEFWKIPVSCISECCWKAYYEIDDTTEVMENLRKANSVNGLKMKEDEIDEINRDSIRYKIWLALENPKSSKAALIWNSIYMLVVSASTLVFFMASMAEYRSDLYLSVLHPELVNYSIPSEKLRIYYMKDMDPSLFVVEFMCMIIFTVELVLSCVLCPCRRKLMCSPMKLISSVLVLSMWLTFAFEFYKGEMIESQSTAIFFMIVRFFTVLRVLLFLRLQKQFSAFRVLLYAIKASLKELFLLCITFGVATVIFACAIFYAEIFDDGTYDNLFIAMWWAIITMTTVGYGDFFPTTAMGYVVGVLCAVSGLLLLAMPVAIIASNFADYYTHNKNRMRYLNSIREERKFVTNGKYGFNKITSVAPTLMYDDKEQRD
ncbi:potassium voltage-gated channel protein egl-36-like [Mizuhopecten yessoensis]|uniref:Potassium voltage-gated channel protein egl-36 n=1 Tax=Mizuhopecten yessoensis TaxID=6573 RepID=A0A210PSV5_MIZYE|nr:potassium voltage-gated channel protein egl-36-like [Mizuhopecten yessoensis]OWF39580.1 Potassium voltage-gated channel protein egl-36 [Mizuhopecten yessoensis]